MVTTDGLARLYGARVSDITGSRILAPRQIDDALVVRSSGQQNRMGGNGDARATLSAAALRSCLPD